MIYEVDANLLEFDKVDAFGHQANCLHTMGSGIAKQIKSKYPELFEVDIKKTRRGDNGKMGKFSSVLCHDGKMGYNLYSQFGFGLEKRQTNYEAMYKGLEAIREDLKKNNIKSFGLPKNMGCALGGGSWRVVSAIIYDVFENSGIDVYICNYTPSIPTANFPVNFPFDKTE